MTFRSLASPISFLQQSSLITLTLLTLIVHGTDELSRPPTAEQAIFLELLLQWLRNRSITIHESDPHDRSQSIKVEYKSNHYQATCRPSITNTQSLWKGYPTTLPKLSMRPASNSLASDAITWPSKLRGSYAWPRDAKGNTVNLNGDILREMSLHDDESLKLSDNINHDSHAKVSLNPKFSNDWINNWIGTNEHQRAGLTELILRKNFEVLNPTKGHIKVWSRNVLVKQRSDAGMWVRTEAPSDWTIVSPPPGMWHPKQKKFMYHKVVPDPSDLRVGRRRHRKYDAVIAVSDISTLESNHKWKMGNYGEVKRRIQILQITNNENSLNETKTDPWMQIDHGNGLSGSSSVSTRLDIEGNYLVGQLEDLKNLSRPEQTKYLGIQRRLRTHYHQRMRQNPRRSFTHPRIYQGNHQPVRPLTVIRKSEGNQVNL